MDYTGVHPTMDVQGTYRDGKEVFRMVYDSSPLSRGKFMRSLTDLYLVIIRNYNRVCIGAELTHGR